MWVEHDLSPRWSQNDCMQQQEPVLNTKGWVYLCFAETGLQVHLLQLYFFFFFLWKKQVIEAELGVLDKDLLHAH